MRKRNITKIADTIFWYTIYMLPVIAYLIYLWSFGQNPTIVSPGNGASSNSTIVGFATFLAYNGLTTGLQNTLVYDTLWSIFGVQNADAVIQILTQPLCLFLTYFACAVLIHFVVDVILFIPRFAMKWMEELTKE